MLGTIEPLAWKITVSNKSKISKRLELSKLLVMRKEYNQYEIDQPVTDITEMEIIDKYLDCVKHERNKCMKSGRDRSFKVSDLSLKF